MSENDVLAAALRRARQKAGLTQAQAAAALGVSFQVISNWERGHSRADCLSLFRLLGAYGADFYDFAAECGVEATRAAGRNVKSLPLRGTAGVKAPGPGQKKLLGLCRELTDSEAERLCRAGRVLFGREAPEEGGEAPGRVIPLYKFLAAAGIPSPLPGEEYDELPVAADCTADFAARIAGDSMEPWIHDGDIVYCRRGTDLRNGDVGIFMAEDGMVCKQFFRDGEGNVQLRSLNRERAEADKFLPRSSSMTLVCYGKVLLPLEHEGKF